MTNNRNPFYAICLASALCSLASMVCGSALLDCGLLVVAVAFFLLAGVVDNALRK